MYIGGSSGNLERIRATLREAPLVALRQQLTDRDILDACRSCDYRFRRRQYDPVVTVFHFLAQAIQREQSFAATWQELWTPVAAAFPEWDLGGRSLSGLTHARRRLPQAVLEQLASRACAETRTVSFETWRGFRLSALDATTVSMPRDAVLCEHFGMHRARTTTVRYPLATFAALLCVGTSLIRDYRFGPFDPGEDKTARPLLDDLGPGDLLLADRGRTRRAATAPRRCR